MEFDDIASDDAEDQKEVIEPSNENMT